MPATVEGGAALARTLDVAAAWLGDLTPANTDAGRRVGAAAKAAAPVRSGRLRSSIGSTPTRTGAIVAASVVYARPINFGWPARGIPPHPYLTETTAGPSWVDPYGRHLDTALRKVHGT